MAILRNTAISLLLLVLAACETDFYPKIDTTPVLCLNSIITAGERIEVSVTHTWVYPDEYAAKHHEVNDAKVLISVFGEYVDADYLPKEGDRIKIEAFSPTYGNAEAEVIVPYAIIPGDVRCDYIVKSCYADSTPGWGITGRIVFDINAAIEIPTSENRDSYYRFAYEPYISGEPTYTDPYNPYYPEDVYDRIDNQNFSSGNFYTPDPIFYEYVSEFEEIMGYSGLNACAFFSDRSFEGKSRPVRFQLEGCGYSMTGLPSVEEIMECGYKIRLFSISKSYFDWAMYYWQWGDGLLGEFSDLGLAEPIWGYSNVSTGAGVVAAQSSTTVTIDLRPFLEKSITEALILE